MDVNVNDGWRSNIGRRIRIDALYGVQMTRVKASIQIPRVIGNLISYDWPIKHTFLSNKDAPLQQFATFFTASYTTMLLIGRYETKLHAVIKCSNAYVCQSRWFWVPSTQGTFVKFSWWPTGKQSTAANWATNRIWRPDNLIVRLRTENKN